MTKMRQPSDYDKASSSRCEGRSALVLVLQHHRVEICHSGTITSLFHHGENPPRLPCRSILTRDSFWSPELSLIKRLISSKLWHRNVFTVGTRLRTPSALPRGCSPRLCRLTGPLLYKQLRMLKCEKLSLSAAARALIKVVGPGGG